MLTTVNSLKVGTVSSGNYEHGVICCISYQVNIFYFKRMTPLEISCYIVLRLLIPSLTMLKIGRIINTSKLLINNAVVFCDMSKGGGVP